MSPRNVLTFPFNRRKVNVMTSHDVLGRTYKLAGHEVRVTRIDAHTVTLGSVDPKIRFVNNTVTHEEFSRLDLEEM